MTQLSQFDPLFNLRTARMTAHCNRTHIGRVRSKTHGHWKPNRTTNRQNPHKIPAPMTPCKTMQDTLERAKHWTAFHVAQTIPCKTRVPASELSATTIGPPHEDNGGLVIPYSCLLGSGFSLFLKASKRAFPYSSSLEAKYSLFLPPRSGLFLVSAPSKRAVPYSLSSCGQCR